LCPLADTEDARHSAEIARAAADEARRVAELARETQAEMKALLTQVLVELRQRDTPID